MFTARNIAFSVSSAMIVVACLALFWFTQKQAVDVNIGAKASRTRGVPFLEHPPYFVAGRTLIYKDGKYVARPPFKSTLMTVPEIHIKAEEELPPIN